MSLKTIVETLGGDLYDGGRRANIPAPGHSAHDRSVSLLLQGGRVIAHAFGGADWREVLDHLRALNLIDAGGAPLSVAAVARREAVTLAPTRLERRDTALRLWEGGRAIGGSLSERYCRARGLLGPLPGDAALRHNPQTPVSAYRKGGLVRPALLAAIRTPDGALTAVEVTYLTPQGRRAADLRLPRKTVGVAPAGCAIRLDPVAVAMLVGEGVFTTCSACAWFGLPGWALGSAHSLRAWRPPPAVRSVLIAADRGQVGERSAALLLRRLEGMGVAAAVALPPAPHGDWNEWAVASDPARRPADAEGRLARQAGASLAAPAVRISAGGRRKGGPGG